MSWQSPVELICGEKFFIHYKRKGARFYSMSHAIRKSFPLYNLALYCILSSSYLKKLFHPRYNSKSKFIMILCELKPGTAWSLRSSGMDLPMPMLHKMPIQRHKVSSHPFPPPSRYFPFSYWLVWKSADRLKCPQPIGGIFPTSPLSLYRGGG